MKEEIRKKNLWRTLSSLCFTWQKDQARDLLQQQLASLFFSKKKKLASLLRFPSTILSLHAPHLNIGVLVIKPLVLVIKPLN